MQALFLPEHDAHVRYHDLPGSEPACVYLHGLGSASSADFPAIAARPGLAGRRSLLVDLLGFGFSDRPAACRYSVDDHASIVATLLDCLGLSSCLAVGHSLGGSIGVRLAVLRPELVSRLVLAEANLEPGAQEGSNAVFSRGIASESEEAYCSGGYRQTLAWAEEAFPGFAARLRLADPRALHRTAVSLVAGSAPTLMEQLLSLTIPRAYVFGQGSLANRDMAERAARLPAGGVRVQVVPNAGHDMAMDTAPEVLAATLVTALA